MSLKKYINEIEEDKKIIDEIKNVFYKKYSSDLSARKENLEDIMKLFINLGNMSYFSGNINVFDHFVKTLLEIININSERSYNEELLNQIVYLGTMSTQNQNINLYRTIINNIKNNINQVKETEYINNYLEILKNFTLKSNNIKFDIGIYETIDILCEINKHFINNNMDVNKIYLDNIIIKIIYNLEKNKDAEIKDEVIRITKDIF